MTCRRRTPEDRYMLAALRRQGLNQSQIAPARHRSTVCREVGCNSTRADSLNEVVGADGRDAAALAARQ